ncbi:hypothetical protein [Streptomyces sp. NPDC048196]|uniref:hypothetical protein n=1 Tax=Streptomyces sp. NPDC048196 TaxID=3154712 RepID=UPI0033C12F53
MSIDSTAPSQPAQPARDPRALYLAALSVAERIVAGAPIVPQSIDTRSYGEWAYGRYGVSVHLRQPADVAAFARWIGAHVATEPRDDGRYITTASGEHHGTPFHAWALHSDAAWIKRQSELAGELADQAHDMYDLNPDSVALVPGCARVGYVTAASDAEGAEVSA